MLRSCCRNNHGRKRTLLDWLGLVLPFTVWIRTYKVKQWLLVSTGALDHRWRIACMQCACLGCSCWWSTTSCGQMYLRITHAICG
jgi:hypothetical protein